MRKRLLLTGHGGSIGIHTVARVMRETDWEIVGIDSFRHKGMTDRLNEHFRTHPEDRERVRVVTHDLTAPFSDQMAADIGHIDYVINMASLSDVFDSIVNPVPFIENNVRLAVNMLELARVLKPEAFIQISTDEVYGPSEGKDHGYREWAPIVPSNPYAASKAAQEAIAISYWRTYDVPVIITNTMNNFGEMQQGSKFPVMIQKAIAEGKTVTIHGKEGDIGSRSYIHSGNFAMALIHILRNLPPTMHKEGEADKPDRYNIAGDCQLDNLELAQVIARIMGKELKYELSNSETVRPGHDKHYGLDDEKIRNTGWKSPVSFEDSLKNTIDWQTANQKWL